MSTQNPSPDNFMDYSLNELAVRLGEQRERQAKYKRLKVPPFMMDYANEAVYAIETAMRTMLDIPHDRDPIEEMALLALIARAMKSDR